VITVVGLDLASFRPAAERLSVEARAALAGARVVVGGRWQLDQVRPLLPATAETTLLDGDLNALDAVVGGEGPSVVLASGDPGFFGVLRALRERLGAHGSGTTGLTVIPGVSSVSATFAMAGVSWDDALVVSAHGRDQRRALNTCRRHAKVAVLTEPGFGLGEIAAELGERRTATAVHGLGLGGEAHSTNGRVPNPNVVLVLDPAAPEPDKGSLWPTRRSPLSWALDDGAFAHRDGMVTKAEVRALVLAWLGPGVGDLVWDVGAGSGSVGIECSRLGAAVFALERDPEQCARVRANAERHDVPIEVVEGTAPDALDALPDPDAVFVGGGGQDLAEILGRVAERGPRVVVTALAAVERVDPARRALVGAGLRVDGTLLQASRLSPLGAATRLAATNPVVVLRGVRP
jgi:precorrin-6Y C5,15-methyltransferase (decarboxylating)